jgi:small subunit ribosomal protein SAe
MVAAAGEAPALSLREMDILMMVAADVHLGTKNCDCQMNRYISKRREDGTSDTLTEWRIKPRSA